MAHYRVENGNRSVDSIRSGIEPGGGYMVVEGGIGGPVVGFGDTEESALDGTVCILGNDTRLTVLPVSRALRRAVDPDDISALEYQVVRNVVTWELLAVEPYEVMTLPTR